MESRAHALAAGIFTLLLGLASALAVFWLLGQAEATSEYILVTQRERQRPQYPGPGALPRHPRRQGAGHRARSEGSAQHPHHHQRRRRPAGHQGHHGALNYQGVTGLASVLLEDKGDHPEPLTGRRRAAAHRPAAEFMDTLGDNAAD
jgi:phospholipid/cholesterol/gamma-HCH transport system substrate-binding protein